MSWCVLSAKSHYGSHPRERRQNRAERGSSRIFGILFTVVILRLLVLPLTTFLYFDKFRILTLIGKPVDIQRVEGKRDNYNGAKQPVAECTAPRDDRPTVFIHGGPPKTGTTSVQDFFACQTDFLEAHNTYFLGKINPRDVKQCSNVPKNDFVRPMVQYKSAKGAAKLREELQRHILEGHNVIISDEDFLSNPELVQGLFRDLGTNNHNAVGTIGFNVVPVTAYRRYHEWLVSLYQFAFKPKWYSPRKKWDQDINIPTFRSFWQSQQNQTHPSLALADSFQSILANTSSSSSSRNDTEAATAPSPPCVQVLNLHNNNSDVVSEFGALLVARSGSNGNNTSGIPPSSRTNQDSGQSFAIDAEILALRLKDEGRVHEKFDRRTVVRLLTNKMGSLYNSNAVTTAPPPPWDCLHSEEEETLLERSIASERAMLSREFLDSPLGLAALTQSFRRASASRAFCNLRFDEMLQESAWESFLLCLKVGGDCE